MQTAYFRFLLISIFGISLSTMVPYLPLQASSASAYDICDLTEDSEAPFDLDMNDPLLCPDMDRLFAPLVPYLYDEDMSVEAMASDTETFEEFCKTLPSIVDIDDSKLSKDAEELLVDLKTNLNQCLNYLKEVKNAGSNAEKEQRDAADKVTADNVFANVFGNDFFMNKFHEIKSRLENDIKETLSYCISFQLSLSTMRLTTNQKKRLTNANKYIKSFSCIFRYYYPFTTAPLIDIILNITPKD